MPQDTTVLLIPGAWHKADTWGRVAKLLEEADYRTQLLDLPTCGPAVYPDNFNVDVTAIRDAIEKLADAGQKVAVVSHSYSSIPTTEAVRDLDLAARQKAGRAGGVVRLVFCCAFIVDEGFTLSEAFGGVDLPWWRISDDRKRVDATNPEFICYNDLPDEEAQAYISRLVPFSYQAFHSKLTYAGWKHVPTTYLYTLQDNAIPMQVQKMMVEGTAKGHRIDTETIDASHSPMLSKPRETADAIRKTIEA